MLLQHARAAARTDDDGVLVPLEEQDRSAWDAARSRRVWPSCGGRCGASASARTSCRR